MRTTLAQYYMYIVQYIIVQYIHYILQYIHYMYNYTVRPANVDIHQLQ